MTTASIIAGGTAMAVTVGWRGTPGWQVGRVVAVGLLTTGALVVIRRGPTVWRGCTAVALGIVGVSAGAGIGVMHLVKSDVDLAAIAGLVLLLSALALLAAGAATLWRITPRWWRLLAIPITLVLLQFGLLPLTTAVYATNVPHPPLGKATPADRGLSYSDVVLHTSDGVRLAAWYIPSRNGAAIALLHGSGSDRTTLLAHAEVLARHGYGALLVDARGHGGSGGDAMDFGWWGNRDAAAAVDWLATSPDVQAGRIGVLGLSMGGEEAIGAAAADPRISAVVAEGALWRGSMDTGWLAHDFPGIVDRGVLGIQTAVTEVLTSAPRPVSLHRAVALAAPRPILLIAGSPELRGDRWYRDASPGNVELWELPDTPHTAGLRMHPDQWETRVIAFFDRALPTPGG